MSPVLLSGEAGCGMDDHAVDDALARTNSSAASTILNAILPPYLRFPDDPYVYCGPARRFDARRDRDGTGFQCPQKVRLVHIIAARAAIPSRDGSIRRV